MVYGQVVIGPPGSGKTTYCNGMSQFLRLIGRSHPRTCTIFMWFYDGNNGNLLSNLCILFKCLFVCYWCTGRLRLSIWILLMTHCRILFRCIFFGLRRLFFLHYVDLKFPSFDSKYSYECAVNIEDLIKLSDVMAEHSLGPNGGLVYCMDYLEKNIDWLQSKLEPLVKDHYLLFDFPGQVELFFLHANAKTVIMTLIKNLNLRLTAMHLVDAHLCSDPGKYVSALLLSLSTMLHLELPHINVLSKIDLIESYGKLDFNLDFYTDVQDLSYLQYHIGQDPRSAKYRKLTKELCDVIEDFSLVNFTTLDIQDKESVGNLVKLVDKSNGYIFAGIEASAVEFSKIAVSPLDWDYYRVAAVQEKYMKEDENSDLQ